MGLLKNIHDLTTAQATALWDKFIGDSGSGGLKGLVPPPSAGDAAASKFLFADGTWQPVTGTGIFYYVVGMMLTRKPTTSEVMGLHTFPVAVTFPVNFANSSGDAVIVSTADATFSVTKNGVSIGTVTFPAATATPVFVLAGGASFAAGDTIEVTAPVSVDATLSTFNISFRGIR